MKRTLVFLIVLIIPFSAASSQSRPDALASYRSGDFDQAIEICLTELETAPRSRDSYSVLCWSLIALERYEEAHVFALEAYQFAPNDPRIVEVLGEANYFLGKNIDALKYFERYAVIADTGDRIDSAYFYMGEVFVRLGEYNHADIAFSAALYHSPNISLWWARLGYAREMAEDYSHALDAYEKALAFNPNLLDADRGRLRVQSAIQSE